MITDGTIHPVVAHGITYVNTMLVCKRKTIIFTHPIYFGHLASVGL